MRRLSYLVMVLGWAGMASCSKGEKQKMKVVYDCGTYLEVGDKSYKVCNRELLENLPEGTIVKVSFRSKDDCTYNDDLITCAAIRPNAVPGWIQITSLEIE